MNEIRNLILGGPNYIKRKILGAKIKDKLFLKTNLKITIFFF